MRNGQMRLTYTDAAFTHHGVPIAGVPVLLSDDMVIVEGPQRWFFYIALDRGRTRSRATWRSYGEALYDWLQTCQANSWAWDDIEEGHLRAYRNQMLYHSSSVTGRPYTARTINGRLRRLAMFYGWAFRRGLIAELPFEYETVRACQDEIPENLTIRVSATMVDGQPPSWWPYTSTVETEEAPDTCPSSVQGGSCKDGGENERDERHGQGRPERQPGAIAPAAHAAAESHHPSCCC